MALTLTCPSCGTELDLDEQHRGWTVRCPDCRHEFVATVAPQARAAAPVQAGPPRSPEAAAADCHAAGVGLTVVGILQLCTCAFVVIFNAVVRPNLGQPINPVPEDEEAETIAAIVVGVLGLLQSLMMLLGAVSLRRQRRFALAMTGAVLALVPNLCCFVTVPFGVWAVVLLGRPDVRAAFAADREPFDETGRTNRAGYFSRSRDRLWRKGEESGHVQEVKGVFVDCDADTVLLKVKQVGGAACHEGYKSCFFRELRGGELAVVAEKVFDPKQVYKK